MIELIINFLIAVKWPLTLLIIFLVLVRMGHVKVRKGKNDKS